LHHRQPEKDENVDFAPPGKISADAHGYVFVLYALYDM